MASFGSNARIALADDIDFADREAGESRIRPDIDRSQFPKLLLQDLQIAAGVEGDLVVGNPQRPDLCLAQSGNLDHRDFVEGQDFRGQEPAMSGDHDRVRVDQDRIGEVRCGDPLRGLLDLAPGMDSRVARVLLKFGEGPARHDKASLGHGQTTAGRAIIIELERPERTTSVTRLCTALPT